MSEERIPWQRETVRVLPVNDAGEVLLLHGFDPGRPEVTFWFTIGGALEAGESPVVAGARELAEETGIVVEVAQLVGPIAEGPVEFAFGRYDITQSQVFYAVAVGEVEVSFAHQEPIEQETIDGWRWWTADDLEASGEEVAEDVPPAMRLAVAAAAKTVS